ncbi:hypothetical protein AAMO2058_001075300 [Amorphochlora amoebiformis]
MGSKWGRVQLMVLACGLTATTRCPNEIMRTRVSQSSIRVLSAEVPSSGCEATVTWYRLEFDNSTIAESFDGLQMSSSNATREWLRHNLADILSITCRVGDAAAPVPICLSPYAHNQCAFKSSPIAFSPDLCPRHRLDTLLEASPTTSPGIYYAIAMTREERLDSNEDSNAGRLWMDIAMAQSSNQNPLNCTIQLLPLALQSKWPLRSLRRAKSRRQSTTLKLTNRPEMGRKKESRRVFEYFLDDFEISEVAEVVAARGGDRMGIKERAEAALVEVHAMTRVMTRQMGAPGAQAAAVDIEKELLDFISKGVYHQLSQSVFSAVSSRVVGQILGKTEKDIQDKFNDQLVTTVSKYVVKDLSGLIPDDLNLFLLSNIAERIIPQLHRDLDLPIFQRISLGLTRVLPTIIHRALRTILTNSLSFALSHSLTSTLTLALSKENTHACEVCWKRGQMCELCSSSPQGSYYSIYYATYYADWFGKYYQEYYTASAKEVTDKQVKLVDAKNPGRIVNIVS